MRLHRDPVEIHEAAAKLDQSGRGTSTPSLSGSRPITRPVPTTCPSASSVEGDGLPLAEWRRLAPLAH